MASRFLSIIIRRSRLNSPNVIKDTNITGLVSSWSQSRSLRIQTPNYKDERFDRAKLPSSGSGRYASQTDSSGKRDTFDFNKINNPLESDMQKEVEFNDAVYEVTADTTLDLLNDYIEELVDMHPEASNFDVVLSQGVLTVNCESHGTFVINKQSPNRQIWFSSPFSGPKRYDWDLDASEWRYRDATLTSLLTEEFEQIFGAHVDFYFLNHKIQVATHDLYPEDKTGF